MVWMFSDELKTEDAVKIRTRCKRKGREDETQIKKRKVGEVTVRFTLFALAITRHMPKPGWNGVECFCSVFLVISEVL